MISNNIVTEGEGNQKAVEAYVRNITFKDYLNYD
jgi:hypothetical protein